MPCKDCGRAECVLEEHKDLLLGELSTLSASIDESKRRNHLYRKFVSAEYGPLGKHNRVKIPDCVVEYICSICPSKDGKYTGFHEVGQSGGAHGGVDGRHTSEGVASTPKNSRAQHRNTHDQSPSAVESEYAAPSLNSIYTAGDSIKFNVSFNHPQFSPDHVRNFIMRAPHASSWTIEFNEQFTVATLICLEESMYGEAFEYCFTNALHCTYFYMSTIKK
jgi:hypothetical protein